MGERLSLTWASGVGDVELVDRLAVGTQARLTAAGEGAHHIDLGGNSNSIHTHFTGISDKR